MSAPLNNEERLFSSLKCIWMSSNIIDYKLCDKDFDCENCIFDKVMHNLSAELTEEDRINKGEMKKDFFETLIEKIIEEDSDNKMIYLKNQLVCKRLFEDTYYIGLNPLLAGLLDNLNSIKDFMGKDYYDSNEIMFKVAGEWGEVPVVTPVSFTKIGMIKFSPNDLCDGKWFALIAAREENINSARVSLRIMQREQLNSISFLGKFRKRLHNIGETMYDGGEKIKYLYQIIGKERYQDMLNNLIKV